ncbi:Fe(3+) ABC transporter substrate-binding protein [Kaistia dalseonensis]|uniref:Iron(III) transport system substrate-binding protein n=1 Tax=Kaistia dalseonensis TaxID=410840 RepID=A0ABU0H8B0_9HYPH|nr:Fe(3+) ABC transporter substrate-binding protein [Kaistia dalseonensis]MCX5495943.1 Fe(3+) ABC transporter substrate-binding protein [Kaistia dalseonensis]MDQ0438546.1 iron(III) transport system substrate-binding protein [Kaistia dalseonensis]
MLKPFRLIQGSAIAALIIGACIPAFADGEVNVYTTREPGLIQPLLETFSKETGIKANVIYIKEGLAQRVETEGANSPADLLSVVDYGNLVELVDRGLTQPVQSAVLDEGIPANLRDPKGEWFGLSMRARVIYASKDRITDEKLTYEDLADPRFKGKVCIRSGQHPYNTSLVAAMIAKDGEEATKAWLTGVRDNLARKAGGGDRDVARDILAGICDIGVGNSYYVGLMRSGKGGPDQVKWGEAIRVILPTFKDGAGTHVNISGAAVAKNAPNRENAVKLLEFLASPEAQEIYAKANFEYPVRPGVAADPIIAALGTLTVDPTPLAEIAKERVRASELAEAVAFDG